MIMTEICSATDRKGVREERDEDEEEEEKRDGDRYGGR